MYIVSQMIGDSFRPDSAPDVHKTLVEAQEFADKIAESYPGKLYGILKLVETRQKAIGEVEAKTY